MLILLHGENSVLSRNGLSDLVSQAKLRGTKDILHLDGSKLTLNELFEACETTSLFGTDRLVIIESLHSHRSKTTLKELINYLSTVHFILSLPKDRSPTSLILWEPKPLSATQLKSLSNFETRLFKSSPLTFKFIDSLSPGKQTVFLPLYEPACLKDTPEFVFFMLARQVRLMLLCNYPESKLPPWQIAKLKSQFRTFGEKAVLKLHDQLYDLDWRLKTGQTVLNLQSELGFILSTL
jgi:DNA polymerase III delta subunit